MLDEADRIWNRACDPFAHHSTSGDRALVPRDAVLEAAFRKRLSEAPEDFAPA